MSRPEPPWQGLQHMLGSPRFLPHGFRQPCRGIPLIELPAIMNALCAPIKPRFTFA